MNPLGWGGALSSDVSAVDGVEAQPPAAAVPMPAQVSQSVLGVPQGQGMLGVDGDIPASCALATR